MALPCKSCRRDVQLMAQCRQSALAGLRAVTRRLKYEVTAYWLDRAHAELCEIGGVRMYHDQFHFYDSERGVGKPISKAVLKLGMIGLVI